MNDVTRILFFETWWSWERPANVPHEFNDYACRTFNIIEAMAWFIFAGFVLHRWIKHRRSRLELWYCAAFVLFGISDAIETWRLTSWLLWWKLINLAVLFVLRRTVMRCYYPEARLF